MHISYGGEKINRIVFIRIFINENLESNLFNVENILFCMIKKTRNHLTGKYIYINFYVSVTRNTGSLIMGLRKERVV